MQSQRVNQRIAIPGGGPSALFLYKHLIETHRTDFEIDIFERSNQLGAGMPYSPAGASPEHVTNVSGNEIPALVTPLTEWIRQLPTTELQHFQLDSSRLSEYKVVPRLLFGQYLATQFELLRQQADQKGIRTRIHLNTEVTDMLYVPESQQVQIQVDAKNWLISEAAIIWPFDVDSFKIGIEAFELQQLAFKNDQALYEAIQQAKVVRKEWVLKR